MLDAIYRETQGNEREMWQSGVTIAITFPHDRTRAGTQKGAFRAPDGHGGCGRLYWNGITPGLGRGHPGGRAGRVFELRAERPDRLDSRHGPGRDVQRAPGSRLVRRLRRALSESLGRFCSALWILVLRGDCHRF